MNSESIYHYACSEAAIRKTFGGVFASDLLPQSFQHLLSI